MKDIASSRKTGGRDSRDIDSEFSSVIYVLQPPSREAGPSTPFAALRSLRMTTLLNEHAVTVTEEAVALVDRVLVGGEDAVEAGIFAAGESADEHEQA